MDSFEQLDMEGRNIFSAYCKTHDINVWDIYFNTNKFDSTDCSYFSGDTVFIGEIKKRSYNHNHFPSQLIEIAKYKELKAKLNNNVQIAYICICPDAIVIYNLTKTTLACSYVLNTWKTHQKESKKNKEVAYLPLEEASHIFKFNGR